MLGVTRFGIVLTPVFYNVIQRFGNSLPAQHDPLSVAGAERPE
jgi:hypothetical protein